MFHFLQKKIVKLFCNTGTINVLQVGEYGQRPYFDHFIFWDPSLRDLSTYAENLVTF